jgi:hypothetical protein
LQGKKRLEVGQTSFEFEVLNIFSSLLDENSQSGGRTKRSSRDKLTRTKNHHYNPTSIQIQRKRAWTIWKLLISNWYSIGTWTEWVSPDVKLSLIFINLIIEIWRKQNLKVKWKARWVGGLFDNLLVSGNRTLLIFDQSPISFDKNPIKHSTFVFKDHFF